MMMKELFDKFGLEEIMTNMHEYTKYAFGDLVQYKKQRKDVCSTCEL